jgi:gliding motility-associated-like protein
MYIPRFFKPLALLSLILSISSDYIVAQTVSFIASSGGQAANSGGSLTICQGQQITFVNTSLDMPSGTIYSWSFDSGFPNFASDTENNSHIITYNSFTSSAIATLTSSIGGIVTTVSMTIVVNQTPSSNINLLNTGTGFGVTNSSGITMFRNCNASMVSTMFNFNVNSNLAGTIQTFDWGDGSPNNSHLDLVFDQISHLYDLGQYTLTHTVIHPNGCQVIRQYLVFNGTAPIVTVSGSGQTTCLPFPYTIEILSNNIATYNVSFTDGSPISIFTTSQDTTISHLFNSSSCNLSYQIGSITIENAFQANIFAINACGFTTTSVGPITISTGTDAQFSYSPSSPICQEQPVTFTNQSISGENVDQNGCSNNYSYYWSMEETTGWSVTNGTMGSNNGFFGTTYDYTQWSTPLLDSVEITFETPGTYHMWLYTANACGIDSIMNSIIINPTAKVLFNPDIQTICSGDFSSSIFMESTIPGYLINWQMIDTFNISGLSFTSGSSVSVDTILPFVITNPTKEMGFVVFNATVGCTNVPSSLDTIYVYPLGDLQVNPLQQSICSNEQTNIQITSNFDEASFSWKAIYPSTITGASDGTGENIAQILFNSGTASDTVTYIVYIGNVICPDDSIVVHVAVQPGINLNQNNDTIVCSGLVLNPVDYISSLPNTSFTWKNSNTAIGLGDSGTGQVPTWTVSNNNSGLPISGTITVTAILDLSCPGTETDFTVIVNPNGNINVSTLDTLICNGEAVGITVESSVSSANIIWTQSSSSSITGANNGSGNLGSISDVLNNDGSTLSIDSVFYTFSISNVQCPDSNVTISVAVHPQITINNISNILVCPSQSISPENFVSTPAGASFSWTNDNTSIGILSNGTGQITSWSAPQNNTSSLITGTITVSAQLNGCPGVDNQFTVSINPIPNYTFNLNPSSGLSCVSPTAEINGTVFPSESIIVWSGPGIVLGQGTSNITINTPGNYSILMTDPVAGCVATEIVIMEPPKQINITAAQIQNITCKGASDGVITITTDNSSGVIYTWSPNSGSGASINGLSPNIYYVLVTNDDICSDDSTFTISEPDPIIVSIIDSVGSECGEAQGSLTINASGGQGGFNYEWNNGKTGAINTGIDAGIHTVTVTDAAGCSVEEAFNLGCTELIPIIVPQLITPNGDGKNDKWIIQNIQQYPEIKVWVYNRWGNLVYQSQPYKNDWNGYYTEGGNVDGPLPASTYFYLIDTMKKSQNPYKGYIEIQP